MLKSSIQRKNGLQTLLIDGKTYPAIAYTTYFEERSRAEDFIKAGYRIFFVNASFTTLPINSRTGFSPFEVGIFEDKEHLDFSEFEVAVSRILELCPDAIIFPRINISMPRWWINSHPDDVVNTEKAGQRESLISKSFRIDASQMLQKTVRHIKSAKYADRIGGWQICGGMTQEWFHHDLNGSLGKCAEESFKAWEKENYGIDNVSLPKAEDYLDCETHEQKNEIAKHYAIFSDEETAKTIDLFAKVIKDETNHSQVVGTFYGYTFEGTTPLFGSHALRKIIDSKNIDFLSSPNAYTNARAFGMDWADMMPVDSIKLHNKLPFIECDIRTYLTTGVQEARPGKYDENIYKTNGKSLWAGPPTPILSRDALRKSFAHQLTKGSGIWWFDMWGGWYNDPILMKEMAVYSEIFSKNSTFETVSEIAFFADEKSWANMLIKSPALLSIKDTRTAMGKIGAPFDTFMVEDAEKILPKCKAAIFPFALPSDTGKKAIELCKKLGIPYLCATPSHPSLTTEEIQAFLKENGIHLYSNETDVVYASSEYVALHSDKQGIKTLKLPKECKVTSVFGVDFESGIFETITFDLEENGTALFHLE